MQDFRIVTSRLRISLILNTTLLRPARLQGLVDRKDVYRAFYVASYSALRKRGVALPLEQDPPVIAYYGNDEVLEAIHESIKRARVKASVEPTTIKVPMNTGTASIAVKALLLGIAREALVKRGFRVVNEYRFGGPESFSLQSPMLIGRVDGKPIEPRFTVYVRSLGLTQDTLRAEIDLAIDYGLVMRENLVESEPGVHVGRFHYYGPRISGSTPLAIVLSTVSKDFKLSNGMTLYEYYKSYGDEYTPEPSEKTIIVTAYRGKLHHKHSREHHVLEEMLTKTCRISIGELRVRLEKCIGDTAELRDANTAEERIRSCLASLCSSKDIQKIGERLGFAPYPASRVRMQLEDEIGEDIGLRERIEILEHIIGLVQKEIENTLAELKYQRLIRSYHVRRVIVEPSSPGEALFDGARILHPIFYRRAAGKAYPPENVQEIILRSTSPLDHCIRVLDAKTREHVCTPLSPSYAFRRRGLEPLPGQRSAKLIVFYPKSIAKVHIEKPSLK